MKAFLDFSEHRVLVARIKVFGFLTESSSRFAELSIETLLEEFNRELTEFYEF